MTFKENRKYSDTFYSYWEDLLDRMPGDVLEATMHMIKHSDEVNVMIADEFEFRNSVPFLED
jgi:hypothetical protein